MSRQAVGLVVFDLGGVLVRVAESWEQALSRAGVEAGAELLGRLGAADWPPLIASYETGRLSPGAFAARVSELAGLGPAEVARVMDAWLIGPYEGVRELVDELAGAAAATACLSNTNARHWALMTGRSHASLPLGRLDHRFASHELGVLKPDDAAYEAVERGTGVPAGEILFFDDRDVNVAAARRRGWQGVLVDPGDPVAAIRAELVSRGVLRRAP